MFNMLQQSQIRLPNCTLCTITQMIHYSRNKTRVIIPIASHIKLFDVFESQKSTSNPNVIIVSYSVHNLVQVPIIIILNLVVGCWFQRLR